MVRSFSTFCFLVHVFKDFTPLGVCRGLWSGKERPRQMLKALAETRKLEPSWTSLPFSSEVHKLVKAETELPRTRNFTEIRTVGDLLQR